MALANGLSFPVATLAKSGKMAPVMLGSLILGGATYGLRDYLQVLCIIGGTAILSMSKKVSSFADLYVVLSTHTDTITLENCNRNLLLQTHLLLESCSFY